MKAASVPAFAIVGCGYLFTSLAAKTITFFLAWNAIGLIVYLAYGRARSLLAEPAVP